MVLFGYVIMSNHIHIVVQSKDNKLSDLILDFKKFTTKQIFENYKQNQKADENGDNDNE